MFLQNSKANSLQKLSCGWCGWAGPLLKVCGVGPGFVWMFLGFRRVLRDVFFFFFSGVY